MKRWPGYRTICIALAGVALVLAGTLAYLLDRPATADCSVEATENHEIHATKVVVQPWLGEHHVYGIFTVPNRYKSESNYAVTMTLRGLDYRFAVHGSSDRQYMDGVLASPGYYLLRRYVPTRLAFWFLIHGLFGDLRHPCNWTLMFIERSP